MKKTSRVLALILATSMLNLGALASPSQPVNEEATSQETKEVIGIQARLEERVVAGKEFDLVLSLENKSDERLVGKISLADTEIELENQVFTIPDPADLDLKPGEQKDYSFKLQAKKELRKADWPVSVTINLGNIKLTDRIEIPVQEAPVQPGQDPSQVDITKIIQDIDQGKIDKGQLPKEVQDLIDQHLKSQSGQGQGAGQVQPDPKVIQDLQDQAIQDQAQALQTLSAGMPSQGPAPVSLDIGGDMGPGLAGTAGSDSSSFTSLSGSQVKNQPKLIVDEYSFNPRVPYAGEEFDLDLSFFNTNSSKTVKNIKVSLTSSTGASPASSAEALSEAARASVDKASPVFTPVGSSNTFYIDEIGSKKTAKRSISLATPPSLETGNYQLDAVFEYEDADGNQYRAQETVGIPVMQETELTTSAVQVPSENSLGQPVDGQIQFYNTGQDTLHNLMVKVEGGFDNMSQEEYIGNFKSGDSTSYMFEVTPTDLGQQKGKIVFTYEDAMGESHTIEKDFKVYTVEMTAEEAEMEAMMAAEEDQGQGFNIPILPTIGLVIVAIAIIYGIYQNRKRKKREEDLTLDED